jgi:excisionase family DNA binding protein
MARLLLRVSAVARALSIGKNGVYSLIRAGQLPAVRICGGRMRVPVSAVEAFVARAVAQHIKRSRAKQEA